MNLRPLVVTTPLLMVTLGCQWNDAELARQSIRTQAEQNQAMALLQREVAAGARELTAADAEASRLSIELQQQIQTERSQLSGGWSDLNSQRRSDAASLRRESFLAAIVQAGGATAAALFALAIVRSVLVARFNDDGDELSSLMLEAVQEISRSPILPQRAATTAPETTMHLTAQLQEQL